MVPWTAAVFPPRTEESAAVSLPMAVALGRVMNLEQAEAGEALRLRPVFPFFVCVFVFLVFVAGVVCVCVRNVLGNGLNTNKKDQQGEEQVKSTKNTSKPFSRVLFDWFFGVLFFPSVPLMAENGKGVYLDVGST